jgi:hypothetical protein
VNLSLKPARNPSTAKSQALRSELPPTLMLIILAEMSAPRTNAKIPPITGYVPPRALRKVRDLPFRISKSDSRRSKLTTPPKQPKTVPINTFASPDVNKSIVEYERSAWCKSAKPARIRLNSINRITMTNTKPKTPCITYAKAVTFDVPKFTSSKIWAATLVRPAWSARAPNNAVVPNAAFEGSSSTGKRPAYLPTSVSN